MKKTYAIFFKNLANPLKLKIISELSEKPMNVNDLTRKLSEEQSKISHALALLRCCSIVTVNKAGKERIYSLNKETILPMLKLIDKHENKYCNKCKALNK